MGKNIKMTDGPMRKRGRPAGKNRTPLSRTERLARNAFYERERREEFADAKADLANSIGCDRKMRDSDLLPAAVQFIHSEAARTILMADTVASLRRENQRLMERLRCLKKRQSMQPKDYPEGSSARTRGYMSRPRRNAASVPVRLLEQVDPQTLRIKNVQTRLDHPAAVETLACGHKLLSVECWEQCMGLGAKGGSPMQPQAAAMEDERSLRTEDVTTQPPTLEAQTEDGDIETIPSEMLDNILEHMSSWGDP